MNQTICNNCGGDYEYRNGRWICRACGAYKPEELSNEEVTLLYTASQRLRLAEFYEAEQAFDDIVRKYPQNPAGYWGRLMARYGIKYEEDFDGRRVPTCYAASIQSVLSDPDYQNALTYADKETKDYYTRQAEYVERVRKEWVEKASKEKPYDVFICYKDSDLANGIDRTEDSITAQELYIHLTKRGYNVFFSRESLRDKVGEKYEPYIFAALSTAKVMLVYGSKPEYITSTWLKNEWTRYEKRIKAGEKAPNSLLVACDGFSPSTLPTALSSRQCFDAASRSFYADLDDMIAHILSENAAPTAASPKATIPVKKKKRASLVIAALCITVAVLAAVTAATSGLLGSQQTTDPPVVVGTTVVTEQINGEESAVPDTSPDTDPDTSPDTSPDTDPDCAHVAVIDEAIPPTCTEDGCTEGAHCLYCGDILTPQAFLAATGHTEVADPAVSPTCTKAGHTEGSHCTTCGEILVTPTYVAPKGHTYVSGTCSACGAVEVVVDQSLFTFSELEDGTYAISATNPDAISGHVTIPAMYNGKLVTEIAYMGFYDCKKITSITLPDSMTSIGDLAFGCCYALTDINIPDSIVKIGVNAFVECKGLTSIVLPNSIAEIDDGAFESCDKLSAIILPSSLTAISDHLFARCSALTDITIPEGVTSIGVGTFYECSSLTSITIPDGVTSIGDAAFFACSSLTSITIPDGVTSIGSQTFSNCSSLTSITIPEGVTSIGDAAFFACSSLTSITFPDSVTHIGSFAFDNCYELKNIHLSNRLTSIAAHAFQGCSNLRSIIIPHSVTNFGTYALGLCWLLTDIYFTGSEEEWNAIDKETNWDINTGNYTVHYNYVP